MKQCFNCSNSTIQATLAANDDAYDVHCANCGKYRISGEAANMQHEIPEDRRWVVAAWIRDNNFRGEIPFVESNFKRIILDNITVPGVDQKFDKALIRISKLSKFPGEFVACCGKDDYPLFWASNVEELNWLFEELQHLNNIQIRPPQRLDPIQRLCLTAKGWTRVAELKHSSLDTNQVFVAMWFSPSMNEVYHDGIRSAIEDDLSYSAMRMDRKEHINRIDDEIVMEIRRSRALVADFTEERGGIYFEAGFALALGKPVIWTCREDKISNVHFDTRQYNFILWRTPSELRERITNRFRALAL